MHSRWQSRFKSRFTQANVGVGSEFDSKDLRMPKETKKKMKCWLEEHGAGAICPNEGRYRRLYEKWRDGLLPEGVRDKVFRDHKAQFTKWMKEEKN